MSDDLSPPLMPGTRNATLPDMVEILRTQRARRLDVVAPAAAIHARCGVHFPQLPRLFIAARSS